MVLIQEKKGGPYSKDEREKRQKEVFRLHFEFGYSAIKISELMKINRNTINEDIKYWYSEIKDELKQNSEDFILRQIGRLEAQRSRIIENITENKVDDIKYEKILLDIDAKINNMLLRINSKKQSTLKITEIKEVVIKDIVLFLIIKYSKDYFIKQEGIISEIVNIQQCTITEAKAIFAQMENLGLECCGKLRGIEFSYDLLEFAYLRKFVCPNDAFVDDVQTLHILHIHIEKEIIRLEKKYTSEYGGIEKWTDEIVEKYKQDENEEMKKYVMSTSDIIVRVLANLSNQKQVDEYIKYLRIFFGKKQI